MTLGSRLRRALRILHVGRRRKERPAQRPRPATEAPEETARDEAPGEAEAITVGRRWRREREDRWRAVACSVAGTSHAATGRPCEDVSVVAEVGSSTLLAVADGAGSAKHARKGATVAVGASVDVALHRLACGAVPLDEEGWRRLLNECLLAARRAVDQCAEPRGELACTLSLVVLHHETLAVARIGDGWVVAQDRTGTVRAVLVPEKGEYFNEAFFVSSDRFLERAAFRIERNAELTAVAVLSDGLEMAACDLSSMEPLRGFFEPIFEFLRGAPLATAAKRREIERLLRSSRINRKTDDDKSLAIAVRGSRRTRTA